MLNIDYIDASVLVKLKEVGGVDRMDKTISQFYEHASQKLELAWKAAKDRDGAGLIQEIQSLKSGIGAVGATGFIEHVTRLEDSAVKREKHNYYAMLEELAAGLIAVRNRLENLAIYLTNESD